MSAYVVSYKCHRQPEINEARLLVAAERAASAPIKLTLLADLISPIRRADGLCGRLKYADDYADCRSNHERADCRALGR